MSEDTGFIPLALPSGLRPYTVTDFRIRPFRIGELKQIRPILKSNDMFGLFDVVRGCIQPIAPEDLTTGDWWYVLAWLRLNTFPHIPLNMPWRCSNCSADNLTSIELSKLEIVELPEDYAEPANLTLISGKTLPLRLRRVGAYRAARDYLKKLKGKDASPLEIGDAELALTLCTTDELKSLEAKMELVDTLSPEDFIEFEDFQAAYSHGLPVAVESNCKECAHKSHVRVRFSAADLVPVGGNNDTIRNSVRFGKALAGDQ